MSEQMVGLARIKSAGGPDPNSIQWRIYNGKYPSRVKVNRKWMLPHSVAVEVVAEHRLKRDLLPLADVARSCGLSPVSLNPKVKLKQIQATSINGRWYLTEAEAARLREYYLDSVTTTEAAHRLGLTDRACFHYLIRRGFPAVRIGSKFKVRVRDIDAYKAGTLVVGCVKRRQLWKLGRDLGLNLNWSRDHDEINQPITYKITYRGWKPIAHISYGAKTVLTMPESEMKLIFGKFVFSLSQALECDGKIDLLLHHFVEKLWEGRDKGLWQIKSDTESSPIPISDSRLSSDQDGGHSGDNAMEQTQRQH